MRTFLALPIVLIAAGCSSGFDSTTVVEYVDSARFYVRQNPVYDSREEVERLAGAVCSSRSARAEFEDELQPYPLDIRYAVYRCVPTDAG